MKSVISPKWVSQFDLEPYSPGIECALVPADQARGLPRVTLESIVNTLEWVLELPF